jgi:hypothetical protein
MECLVKITYLIFVNLVKSNLKLELCNYMSILSTNWPQATAEVGLANIKVCLE